jgi:hypothetical protein
MEHGIKEADSLSANQEMSRLSWNPNIHHCIHNSLPQIQLQITKIVYNPGNSVASLLRLLNISSVSGHL